MNLLRRSTSLVTYEIYYPSTEAQSRYYRDCDRRDEDNAF